MCNKFSFFAYFCFFSFFGQPLFTYCKLTYYKYYKKPTTWLHRFFGCCAFLLLVNFYYPLLPAVGIPLLGNKKARPRTFPLLYKYSAVSPLLI